MPRPASPPLLLTLLALFLVATQLMRPASAQASEALRDLWGASGYVRSSAIAGDTLYVGGDFGLVGPPTGGLAALDKQTGAPDLTRARIGGVSTGYGGVSSVLPDGAGGYYVGGEFEWTGGVPRRNLAHVLADGTLDAAFHPDPQTTYNPYFFGYVKALALHDGVLYVGGRFDTVGGRPRLNVAALDASTGVLLPLSFTMSAEGQSSGDQWGSVEALVVRDGVLYVGGTLDEVNGLIREGAFAADLATGAVLPWDPRLTSISDPTLTVGGFGLGDSTLYLSGLFDRVGGLPRRGGAEVSLADPSTGEGGAPTPWNPGTGFNGPIVGDYIWTGVCCSTYSLGRIHRRTGGWEGFLDGSPYRDGRAVAYDPEGGPSGQGLLYVAAVRLDTSLPRGRYPVVFAVDPATVEPTGFEVRATPWDGYVGALAVEPGPAGRVLAGGTARQYGAERRRLLAALDLTTGVPTPFATDVFLFSSVEELAVSPDERYLYLLTFNGLIVADLATGEFATFPGTPPFQPVAGAGASRGVTGPPTQGRPGGPEPIRQAGPAVAGPRVVPHERLAARMAEAAARGGGADTLRVRGSGSSLIVTADRLYFVDVGGAAAYDRLTGTVLWATPFAASSGFTRGEPLLVQAGPPGAAGDTLFVSGPLREAGGLPRDNFAALDAATGAVLDWYVGAIPENGTSGQGFGALGGPPGEGRLYLGGAGVYGIGGEPRREGAAVARRSAALLDWAPVFDGGIFGMTAQAGPGGGVAGGVVYAVGGFYDVDGVARPLAAALDAETGAVVPGWDPAPSGNFAETVQVARRQGWVVITGAFDDAARGGGFANVVAVRPAPPYGVGAEEPGGPPAEAALRLVGPNPFRDASALALALPTPQHVSVGLYDVLGRRVAVLHDGPLAAGTHRLEVDGSALPAGVYVARVVGEGFTASRTLTLVR